LRELRCTLKDTVGVVSIRPITDIISVFADLGPGHTRTAQMSYASRRNAEKAGFLVALAIALILMTVLVAITIRNATRYGVTVWQVEAPLVRP
jgi:hypothetical protein